MTQQTGFVWLREFLNKKDNSIYERFKSIIWRPAAFGQYDEHVFFDFIYVIYVAIMLFIDIFTFLLWPIAIYKDYLHFKNDLSAAFASLICVTPAYVIFMIPLNVLGFAICLILAPISLIYDMMKLLGMCFASIWIAATRKYDETAKMKARTDEIV